MKTAYKDRSVTSKDQQCPLVVVSGIGTGGHYFPALVVARELVGRSVPTVFLVRKGYVEERIARDYNLITFAIRARGFYGKSLFGKVLSVYTFFNALFRLGALTRRVVGITFGGFGTVPLAVSCLLNRRPYYLFEPNRIPGRAARLFARRARKVFLGLPPARPWTNNEMVTGIPIRPEFKITKGTPRRTRQHKQVLFYGGSQGATRLNQLALALQAILPGDYQIVIICGRRDYPWLRSRQNGRTRVIDFTDTPWREISNADLIVSRSGALAGYEIIAAKKPVIFIPFPHAIDDHQYYNAEYFSKIGDAIVIREQGVSAGVVSARIIKMLRKGRVRRPPRIVWDAERRIVDIVLKEQGCSVK